MFRRDISLSNKLTIYQGVGVWLRWKSKQVAARDEGAIEVKMIMENLKLMNDIHKLWGNERKHMFL